MADVVTTTTLLKFDRLDDALANVETCGELSLQGVAAIPPEVGTLRRLRRIGSAKTFRIEGDATVFSFNGCFR